MWKRVCVFFVTTLCWSYVLSEECVTPLGKNSNCVSLYDCHDLLVGFQQRPIPSNVIYYLRQSQCGFDGNTPRVCCGPLPATSSVTQPDPPRRTTPQTTISSEDVEDSYAEDSSPAPRSECGVATLGDRIYGGILTDLDEFPWMALLGYKTHTGKITYQCGGGLINHRYVLTAAHCITGAIEIKFGKLTTVRLGEYDTLQDIDCIKTTCADPPQEIPVALAIAYSDYSDKNKGKMNDIGIVRLARRATYTYYVKPICLTELNQRTAFDSDLVVAGWGKTLEGENSNVKLKLAIPFFNKDECVNKYVTVGVRLGENQLCAGGKLAEDTCRGDSGGPLMLYRGGTWEAVGVVSFGYGCGRDGWPGVYTAVAGYIDWIRSTIRNTNQ